jgi:hypothetical protein
VLKAAWSAASDFFLLLGKKGWSIRLHVCHAFSHYLVELTAAQGCLGEKSLSHALNGRLMSADKHARHTAKAGLNSLPKFVFGDVGAIGVYFRDFESVIVVTYGFCAENLSQLPHRP